DAVEFFDIGAGIKRHPLNQSQNRSSAVQWWRGEMLNLLHQNSSFSGSALPSPFCSPVSCAALDDAVNPAALLLGRGEGEPELLFEGSREDATHGVALPARRTRYLIDRHTFGSTQHRDDLILLRGALCLGLSLRVGQHLHRRPQFVDQRVAVADFPALLDTGESIP